LVNSIITLLGNPSQRETFMAKLQLYGFDFSNENDNQVFAVRSMHTYKVDTQRFPRLHRSSIPDAITRAQYEILLTEIEQFKVS